MSHRLLVLFASLGLFAASASAQEEALNEVLVFGDVAKAGVYQVKTRMTVTEILTSVESGTESSLLRGASANVRLIRGGTVAWGSHISKNQPCNFNVTHGDMLVVHSMARMSGRSASRTVEVAVINPTTRPLLLELDAGKVTIGAVLAEVEMDDRPFRIIRTDPRSTPIEANTETILMHGDVLMVNEVANVQEAPVLPTVVPAQREEYTQSAAAPQRLMVPVSATQETPLDGSSFGTSGDDPIPVRANYGGVDSGTAPQPGLSLKPPAPPVGGSVLPELQAAPNQLAPIDNQSLNTDPWMMNQPNSAQVPGAPFPNTGIQNPVVPNQGNPGVQPPAFGGNGFNNNAQYPNQYQSGSAPPAANAPGYPQDNGGLPPYPNTASTNGVTADQAAPGATQGSIPLPNDLDSAVKEGSSSTMWYVAGLFGAVLLVLGAWVYSSRAMADTPQVRQQDQYKRPVSRRHSTKIKHQPVSRDIDPGIPSPAAKLEKPAAPTIKPIAAASNIAATAAGSVVGAVQSAANAVTPRYETPQVTTQGLVASAPATGQLPPPGYAPPSGPIAAVPAAAVAPVHQAPVRQISPAAPVQQAPASIPQYAAPQPVAPSLNTAPVAPAQPEPIPVPDTDTTRILDALINNAIPINEQPVQLPAHLEFYGDSNGPKQLRIDPPQSALRGPHIGQRAGVNQQQQQQSSSDYAQ